MAAVEIADARKSCGIAAVINGFRLDAQDGEFVILAGPTGSRQVDPSARDRQNTVGVGELR